ncbi:MAG: phytoene/squalene synthase family protein [Haloarculaceae archaeon]
MPDSNQLATSKAIQRRTGKTFHLATRLFPERVRHRTYVLYAFFRVADEVVDDPDRDLSPAEQRAALERIRAAALGEQEPTDPVLSAFDEVRREAGLRDEDVAAFLDAMAADVDTARYETYADLEEYVHGSAAAVGLLMTDAMGVADPERARPHAAALGTAFQLTNFLRDVREDVVDRDRIYLPAETLERYGSSHAEVAALEYTSGFRSAVAHELRRAERLYREGVAGIQYLPADCQFAVVLAAVLYADHHRLIREQDYDVLSATPSLSTRRKLWLAVRTRWHWALAGDPEAVFERVSCVGTASPTSVGPEPPETLPVQ